MEVTQTIKVKFKDLEIELTREEAVDLRNKLDAIVGSSAPIWIHPQIKSDWTYETSSTFSKIYPLQIPYENK